MTHFLRLLPLHILLLELREEALPIFLLERRVLGQLPLDHQRLNVVDRVDVAHAVLGNASNLRGSAAKHINV